MTSLLDTLTDPFKGEKPKTVLIVDDDRQISTLVSTFLKAKGYGVEAAYNGQDGVKRTLALQPDLVLLDIKMPDMEGTDVCKILRSNPKTSKTAILMFTVLLDIGHVETSFKMGADDYITKPFNLDHLHKKIQKYITP